MATKKSFVENTRLFLDELTKLTKSALYFIARQLHIPGRSAMTKSELVSALNLKKKEVEPVLAVLKQEELKEKPMDKISAKMERKPASVPEEKRTVARQAVSSIREEPKPPVAPSPVPGSVWMGEEGPELPREYGVTVLRAMPRDPFWAYVYWEISEETIRQLRSEAGEWIFDVAMTVLRVFEGEGAPIREIPVLLDALSWYISLPPSRSYEFELGLSGKDGYRVLARSNRITLPPAEPSAVTDEKWLIVEEKFEQMMEISGGVDFAKWGGSAGVMPHLLRQRIRVPWAIHSLERPSSHLLGVSSSVLQSR